MPFKSEKQRRFLWATRPDIAKKWADKYPESNKGLPMYAADTDDTSPAKEKAAQINIWALFSKNEGSGTSASPSILPSNSTGNFKKADSKQERVDIPQSEKPVYAGEEREKGMISSGDDLGDKNNESCGGNAINELLQKLSVVLAPKIEQTMENLEAEREGRVPRRVGNNTGLKHYPLATPQIPLPMGMQTAQQAAQPQQTQQSKPASPTPVGAGQSSATTDPIKFHSGLSASGIINGNAALSAPNTVNTKISAETPAKKPKKKSYPINRGALAGGILAGSLLSKLMRAGYRQYSQEDSYGDVVNPEEAFATPQFDLGDSFKFGAAGNPVLSQMMSMDHCSESEMLDLLEMENDSECVKAAVEKWAGKQLGLWDRIRMKRQRGEKPASPGDKDYPDAKSWSKVTAESEKKSELFAPRTPMNYNPQLHKMLQNWEQAGGDNNLFGSGSHAVIDPALAKALSRYVNQSNRHEAKLQGVGAMKVKPHEVDDLDAVNTLLELESMQPKQKAAASTPAWQRAAGKNDEGGLNAKGRASYNRATGGNLKAPVTEKNPTGERDKRQNSFCSRMCGMKRVNTGSKTKKDPDSRINKALRKWNCKCSAAESFGKEAAKRVLNLSPSWGGQKWQLGEWGINPQAGYRYLGGVLPTPDIALRLGGPLGGTAVGLAPFPYIETDWGRPSGRQANKETRSLYKWIGDGMRDRPTAAAHALANVPEDATAEDYEAAMRSSGVGYSSKELKRLADRMAKMGPLQLPVE